MRIRAAIDDVSRRVALPGNRTAATVWGAVAIVILAAAILAVVWSGSSPAPGGTMVIDAVPWGTVTAIEAEDGQRQPLPSPASTPLAINLAVGTYQVLVAGPTPESPTQRISVKVEPGAASVIPPVRFSSITPEAYFEQYLAAPAPAATSPPETAPSAVTTTTPAVPVASPGVSQ